MEEYAPDELKLDKEEEKGEKEEEGASKEKEGEFHDKLDKMVHKTFGKRPEEKKMKEEVELDENLLGSLDQAARDTAGRVGETIGRNRGQQTGIPGAGTLGGVLGSREGKRTYDDLKNKATQSLGGLLKQDYEPDNFDIILEYLVAEGYADTNKAALAIMANMSEEWKQDIVEAKYGTEAGRKRLAKKIRKGEKIGKSGPGTGFKAVEKAAKEGGAEDPAAVAAAQMWKTHAGKKG